MREQKEPMSPVTRSLQKIILFSFKTMKKFHQGKFDEAIELLERIEEKTRTLIKHIKSY